MANELLNSLLKEYEHKKMQAELDLEKRKELLYKKIPRLSEIESEIYPEVKKAIPNKEFLMVFTFGEYGVRDHGANTTGGLMLSFTAFGK